MLAGSYLVKFLFFLISKTSLFLRKKRQGPNYVNAKTFLFWRFAKLDSVFLNVPKNAEKYAKIFFQNMSRSLVGSSHLDEKGHMETRYSGQKTLEKAENWRS